MQWSKRIEDLFEQEVNLKVRQHPKTDQSENIQLGYPFDYIRKHVIVKGLADFTTGQEHATYGAISADDKALLYCFMNMRQHFFESRKAFQLYRSQLNLLEGI